MNRRILLLSMAALVAGCGAEPPRRTRPAMPAAARETAPREDPAAQAAEPEFVYTGAGKRDPFRSYLAELARDTSSFATRCPGPLGKYEIEQMKLVAVIIGLEDPVAMVEVPDTGEGVVVRRGQCIGKNGGVVAAVRTGEVIVTEYRIRADGTRDAIQTSLQLPKQQASYED